MRLLAAHAASAAPRLAQYAACRQVLAAELNAEPSAATTALYEQLKATSRPTLCRRDRRPHPVPQSAAPA